ncbi:MAG: hypothetical protein U0325_03645 [Polyangiales bacterium]
MRSRGLIIALALTALAAPARAQLRQHFDDPALSLALPPDFAPFRPPDRHASVIDTFRRPPRPGGGPIVVQLLRLGDELPQRDLTREERAAFTLGAPFGFDDHPMTRRGLGHTLPASVGRARTPAGAPVVRLAVLLPTRGNAVQLSVLALAAEEAEARRVLDALLDSARAEVSWLTFAQRAAFAAATICLALAALGTLVIVVRVLLQGHVTHLGPAAQRRIAAVTGASWLVFALWLLIPIATAEWAAAVPAAALAVTFLARSRAPR